MKNRTNLSAGAAALLIRMTRAMAWISGLILLLLSFYITIDTIGRSFGWFYSGLTEGVSAYALAVAGSWGIAFALYSGRHVRIDLLLPAFPPQVRWLLDLLAIALAGIFTLLLAYQTMLLALRSLRLGTRSISTLEAPLYIPQFLLVWGLFATALVALLLTIRRVRAFLRGTGDEDGGDDAGAGGGSI